MSDLADNARAHDVMAKDQLQRKTADVGIERRSKMDEGELIQALRNH